MERKTKRKETWFGNYMNYRLYFGIAIFVFAIILIIAKVVKEVL
jgi:hypothetical protein